MKNLNQTREIKSISNLQINGRYFSRAMDTSFTVLEINHQENVLKLGVGDILKEVKFIKFNRVYLKEGIIVN